jgi:CDP-diacylglycerol--glycerol-3-phosphate 3-phosphatidyltransferase
VPSIYQLKPRFQNLLRPYVARGAAAGVTANQVTAAAMAGSLAIGFLVLGIGGFRPAFLLISLWLPLRMALNAVDGMLAREFGQKSALGAYLNELGDLVSDAALYAPFALVAPFGPVWIGIVIVLAIASEFAGALGPLVGAERQYQGPSGKSDRAALFGVLGVWIAVSAALPDWLVWLMPILAGLLVWTIVNRIRGGLAEAAARATE